MSCKMQYALVPTDQCAQTVGEGATLPQNPCSTVYRQMPLTTLRQSQESVYSYNYYYIITHTRAVVKDFLRILRAFCNFV